MIIWRIILPARLALASSKPGRLPVMAVNRIGVTKGWSKKPIGSCKGFGTGLLGVRPNRLITSAMGSSVDDPFKTFIIAWMMSVEGAGVVV